MTEQKTWTAAKEKGNWIVRSPDDRRASNFWNRWREAKKYVAEMNKRSSK